MRKNVVEKIRKISMGFFDGPSLKLMKHLPDHGGVTLADVGAAGGIQPRWKPFSDVVNYIGFEPDTRSREKISNIDRSMRSFTIVPHALAEAKKTSTLYLCKKPEVSSLYSPNFDFLERFPDPERFEVEETLNVHCVSLDSLKIAKIDFLKIDIQGAEKDVLRGASSTLARVLGVEVEVEFLELYQGQPLFGDVCEVMSQAGFEFIDFVNLQRWERRALGNFGQCVFGDALFLKTPERILSLDPDIAMLSAYVLILTVYRRFDLIETVLDLLPKSMAQSFSSFRAVFVKVKRRDAGIKLAVSFMNRFFSLLSSETRLHLIR